MNRRKNVLDFFHVYLFSTLLNLTNTKKMGLVDLKKVTVDCWIFLKGSSLSYILFGHTLLTWVTRTFLNHPLILPAIQLLNPSIQSMIYNKLSEILTKFDRDWTPSPSMFYCTHKNIWQVILYLEQRRSTQMRPRAAFSINRLMKGQIFRKFQWFCWFFSLKISNTDFMTNSKI